MRPIISALLLMLLATPVVASENRYLDSLWQVYRSSSLDEGSRLLVLHEIVNEVRYEDLDSARTLASVVAVASATTAGPSIAAPAGIASRRCSGASTHAPPA